jgi:hypothetical protein
MPRKPITVEEALTLLAATPARISAATDDLPLDRQHAAPGEWSANDVLAHLRACADVWGGCIRTILAEDHPTLRAIDPRTWMAQTNYPDLDFQDSFRSFATQRADLLSLLELLPPDDWSRTATVTGAGRPLVRSVQSYAEWLARHERPHIRQIERAVAATDA